MQRADDSMTSVFKKLLIGNNDGNKAKAIIIEGSISTVRPNILKRCIVVSEIRGNFEFQYVESIEIIDSKPNRIYASNGDWYHIEYTPVMGTGTT